MKYRTHFFIEVLLCLRNTGVPQDHTGFVLSPLEGQSFLLLHLFQQATLSYFFDNVHYFHMNIGLKNPFSH